MLVPIKIWTMSSDAGYRESSGHQSAIVVPANEIPAGAFGAYDQEALYYLLVELEDRYHVVQEDELQDAEPYVSRTGALNYRGMSGLYDVPEGMTVFIYCAESICTNDETGYFVELVEGTAELAKFYRERAAHYAQLAEDLEQAD